MAFDSNEIEKALAHDAARRGQPPEPPRPVAALRQRIQDAVLLAEKASLLLDEGNAYQLRDDLMVAAHKLKLVANHLTHPHLYPLTEGKR